MAKKKTEIIKAEEIPADDMWLYSPTNYSQIGGDFSMLQQRILAGILEQVQENIIRSINGKEKDSNFPSLFSEEEMRGETMELFIDPAYFGISPEHYDYLEEALADLANTRIAFPKPSKDKLNYVIAPLFARLEIPRGKQRRKGKVRVVMLNENINDFMSMDKGYTLYMARITRISKKARTPRIYQFLSSFQNIGHKKVAYMDFCKFLGIDDETARANRLNKINQQRQNKEITQKEANERLEALAKWENPFRKFNKVRTQIIEPAKMELDMFTAPDVNPNDEIDFTFEYEPLYENVSRRGNPSHLQFTIIKKRLALIHQHEQDIKRQRHSLTTTLCDRYRDMNVFDLREVISRVGDDDFDEFKDYVYTDVAKVIEKKQPDNPAAYALTMMENWITDQRRKKSPDKSACLFDHQKPETPEKPTLQQGDGEDKWQQLIGNLSANKAEVLQRVNYLGIYNDSFCVDADDELWALIDCDEVMTAARQVLQLPKFAPGIVRGKNM